MSHYNSRDSDILAALKRRDVLTPAIANTRWGVLALHSAIARLRKQGHAISCRMRDGHGEYRFAGETKAAPQPSTAVLPTARTVPSHEGAGQGEVAGAAPHEQLINTYGRSADGKRTYPLAYVAVGFSELAYSK